MDIKRFEDFNGKLNENTSKLSDEQKEILQKLEQFMDDYETYTLRVSPKHWRVTGHHFSELRKMQEDIPNFTSMTPEEKRNPWVEGQLDDAEMRLIKKDL